MAWPLVVPKILTDADWQKNKGKIAKMAGKTGIGESLDALGKAHKKVEAEKLTAGGYGKPHTVEDVAQMQRSAQQYYNTHCKPVIEAAQEVQRVCNKTLADWKKKPLIPKDSRKHVEEIRKAADLFAISCKNLDEEAVTFKEEKDRLIRHIEIARKSMAATIKSLEDTLAEVRENPTADRYDDGQNGAFQKSRAVSNWVFVVPEWKAEFWDDWKNAGNDNLGSAKGKPKEREIVLARVEELEKALKRLKKGIAK